jgi:hypothetical protein
MRQLIVFAKNAAGDARLQPSLRVGGQLSTVIEQVI